MKQNQVIQFFYHNKLFVVFLTNLFLCLVFEVVFEAPYFIKFLFLRGTNFVSLIINVESGGIISASLNEPFGEYSEYFVKLLEKTHHIPLSLHKLFTQIPPS